MRRQKTIVIHLVPRGPYCNIQKTARCRFCTEVKKNVFVCVLYNEPLEGSALIYKTDQCLNKVGTVEDAPLVPPRELMKHTITEYHKAYIKLIASGVPEKLADKAAQEEAMK